VQKINGALPARYSRKATSKRIAWIDQPGQMVPGCWHANGSTQGHDGLRGRDIQAGVLILVFERTNQGAGDKL
jgi:hypothetical protein